jgi:uncharacterized membrane protein YeaQ/YmgE (transglycosylase-associated protein family)
VLRTGYHTHMITTILLLILTGLIVGALARLALPGPDPMSIGQTILLGVAGSLIAGILAAVIFDRGAGIVLAVLASSAILYFIRRSRGGSLTRPGAPPT